MAEIELKGNSFREKEKIEAEEERAVKVTTGKVTTKEASTGKKLVNDLVNKDMHSVRNYVLFDVIVPAVKDMLSAGIRAATDMILYNDVRDSGVRRGDGSRRDYNAISRSNQLSNRRAEVHDRFVIDDVYFDERLDADKVLDQLTEEIDIYGRVSAYKFYDYCGLSCDYTLKNWGWFDLNSASVVRTRNGDYTIKLPRLVNIK